MDNTLFISFTGIFLFFILLILRIPVALSMICIGIAGNYAISLEIDYLSFQSYIKQFKTLLWGIVANYELSVIPLFILMGNLCAKSGLSHDLFQGIRCFVGRIKAGVLIASLLACAGFGAISGSSLATASTMGKAALPELKKLRYNPQLSAGVLAAGGTLGILIPPSTVLVLYAIMVEASIIDMFQAAIIPGLLALLFFIIITRITYTFTHSHNNEKSQNPIISDLQYKASIRKSLPIIGIFLLIIVGLGLGLMTPTPAASVGVALILAYIGFLRIRQSNTFSLNNFKSCLYDTAGTTGMIYFLLFGAEVFKSFITRSGLPIYLSEWALTTDLNGWIILICFLAILIIMGFFLESLTMILVVIPFFWPVLVTLNGGDTVSADMALFGLDHENLKIWFGILSLTIVELGLITPPMGLNVFIIGSLDKSIAINDIFKGIMPFLGGEIIRIILLLAFPILCLWLPHIL